eukprot:903923-Rhodomonas_salina.1
MLGKGRSEREEAFTGRWNGVTRAREREQATAGATRGESGRWRTTAATTTFVAHVATHRE